MSIPQQIERILAGFAHDDVLPLAESIYLGADPSVRSRVLAQLALVLNTNAPPYLKAFTLMKLADYLRDQRLFSEEQLTAIHSAVADLLNNRIPKNVEKPKLDKQFLDHLQRTAIKPDNVDLIKKELAQLLHEKYQKSITDAKSLDDLTNKLIELGTKTGYDYFAVLGHTLVAANEPPMDFLIWGMDVNNNLLQKELQTTKQLLSKAGLRSEKLRAS